MGTDNRTPVEYIHIGLSWTHLLKPLVYQLQKDLHLGDSELDAGRDSKLLSDKLLQVRPMCVETQFSTRWQLPSHNLSTRTYFRVSAVDSSRHVPPFWQGNMSKISLRYAYLVNIIIS